MLRCCPQGGGLSMACRVNRTDLLEERRPPQRSFPSTKLNHMCNEGQRMREDGVCVCMCECSLIILTWVAVHADTTPCVEANRWDPAVPKRVASMWFLPIPPIYPPPLSLSFTQSQFCRSYITSAPAFLFALSSIFSFCLQCFSFSSPLRAYMRN